MTWPKEGSDIDGAPVTILLMRLVDILVLLTCAAVLVYIFRKGLMRSSLIKTNGRWLLVGGVALFMVSHAVEFALKMLDPNVSFLFDGSFRFEKTPPHLHWLMSRSSYLMILFGMLLSLLYRARSERHLDRDRSAMIRAAQTSVMESEARFRSLLDTTSNSVYCFAFDPPLPTTATLDEHVKRSHDASLVECNTAFVAALDLQSAADAIGVRLGELDSAKDAESHARLMHAFVESGYRLQDYELVYKADDGSDKALNISLTGIVEDGCLQRVWGSETDIQDLRSTQSDLTRRRAFQDLIAGISSYMIMTPIENSDRIVEHCLEEISRFVGADRSSLLWINWADDQGDVNYRWNRDNDPMPDKVTLREFPYLGEMVRAGRVIRLDDVSRMPRDASADRRRLQGWKLKSFVALPLSIAGEVHGVVTFGVTDEVRPWSDQDILDLRVVAELFANFVSRLKGNAELEQALDELERAKDRLEAENVYLREEIETSHGFDEIVGDSDAILKPLRMIEMVAATDTPVLVLGETGTGKELVARAIHQRSRRNGRPLVKVNCAALPANLIESELFGYERGAFTGATARKRGRFDLADGSTLFLDEFGEMPIELQSKLLRVLQEGEFERLGGTETIRVDVRLIVATNRDLAELVRQGSFRSDLYYRVNTFPIAIPPLREREGDIELLAMHFLKVHSKQLGKSFTGISRSMMRQLHEYHWPGNVRELEGVIQRAVIANRGGLLALPEPLVADDDRGHRVISSTIADLSVVERDHIINVLEASSWKISGPKGAASRLGLPPSTLRSKMKKLDIVKPH